MQSSMHRRSREGSSDRAQLFQGLGSGRTVDAIDLRHGVEQRLESIEIVDIFLSEAEKD